MADSTMIEPPEKRAKLEETPDDTVTDQTLSAETDQTSILEPSSDKSALNDDSSKLVIDSELESNNTAPSVDDPSDDPSEDKSKNNPDDIFDDNDARSSDEDEEEEANKTDKTEIPLEPFNMEEEKEMGTFDKDYNFTWKTKSREPTDAWLANEGAKPLDKDFRRPAEETKETESDSPTSQELKEHLSNILAFMKGKETVQAAINRMSNPVAASASARLALKKAGGSYQVADSEKSDKLIKFLSYVTRFPVKADACSLTRHEILDMMASEDLLNKFMKKAYPTQFVDLISGSDSEGEVEEVPSKKAKKLPVLMSVSSSDEDEGEDKYEPPKRKPAAANGDGDDSIELDMFAE